MLNNNMELIDEMANDGIMSPCAFDNVRVSPLVFAIKCCYDDVVSRLTEQISISSPYVTRTKSSVPRCRWLRQRVRF